jgi:hypothetical protein
MIAKRTLLPRLLLLPILLAGCISSQNPTPSLQPQLDETGGLSTPGMSGQGDPQIKIELSNPNRFEIRNAPMVLQFGPAEIYVG